MTNMYEVEYEHVTNTDKFRAAAITFKKYGYYIAAPAGTSEYMHYWDRETLRCLEGFNSDDGDFISGYMYFYLNYSPIMIVEEKERTGRKGKKRMALDRVKDFPNYWDSDKQFFDAVEKAEEEGSHLAVLKARGKGYSFKTASMLNRNFFLIPGSTSYAIASEKEFLVKDGILSKAWEMMNFVNQHTAWYKKRQGKDTEMHKRASIIMDNDGKKVETGYMSEIIGITLKNDIQKARGKRGKLILWEEAGKFPGLLDAWQIARPSVEQGDSTYGLMIAFGTGGTEEGDFGSLKELFYAPKAYNLLPIRNTWDTGAQDTSCGFFIPEYMNLEGFMTEDGNSQVDLAMANSIERRRVVEEHANDRHAIDRYIAERPMNPMEATLQLTGNIFPKKELAMQVARIQTNEKLRNYKQVGELLQDAEGKFKWVQTTDAKDIIKYPLEKREPKQGSIVIWEHPDDSPPHGLYVAGCDPYDHDDSGTGSLGSTFIYKRFQNYEEYYDLLVAEYTGRPDTADEYYENAKKLLLYYNARMLYENERKGLFAYFTIKSYDYLLADQPDLIGDIVKDSRVKRRKGIHMVEAIKAYGEREIRDWLNEEYAPGKKNLTNIMSVPLLQELIAYNDKGNFDRVMALMMVMIYKKELHNVHVKKKESVNKIDPFFTTPLYPREKMIKFNLR